MTECFFCEAKFEVQFDNTDYTLRHCPACGEELGSEGEELDPEYWGPDWDE